MVACLNATLVTAFIYLGAKAEEQNQARKRMIVELAGANRRLEEMMAENTGLHAQLLTQAREAGVLEERQRMAREIHDTLAQGLAGIITQLEAAQQAHGRAAGAGPAGPGGPVPAARAALAPTGNGGSGTPPGWPGTACPRPAGRSGPSARRRWRTPGCPTRWPRWRTAGPR